MKVVVIGAGAAGTAAAWRAAENGAEVHLIHEGRGATSLYPGALDLEHWDSPNGDGEPSEQVVAFAAALGIWKIGPARAMIATRAGVARPARGIDTSLLDMAPLAGRRIAVADVEREGWDANGLATCLGASRWAIETSTRFDAVVCQAVKKPHEQKLSDYDFAALHDDPGRADWLADQLRGASTEHDAWLLGPWLGVETDAAERLRSALGVAVGETLSPPGGAAGARFDRARERLLGAVGAFVVEGRAGSVAPRDQGWRVEVATQGPEPRTDVDADAVVLAVGGMLAGGVTLDVADDAYRGGTAFHLSVEAPVRFELDGEDIGAVSTLHGVELDRLGVEVVERVGVMTEGSSVRGARGLFAAGDVVAGRPRTVLQAVGAGIAAAEAATAAE